MTSQIRRALLAAMLLPVVSVGRSRAADYPDRAIKAVVALGAGGSMDVIARIIGQKIRERSGQPFVIENRGGAGGNLAAESVARASPDGYTLLVAHSAIYAINGRYFKTLSYDPARDLEPIALTVKVPFVLVTAADSPITSLEDVIAAARERPGRLTFASTGVATAPHLAGELFKARLGIDLTHVPYRGSMSQATSDVMAKQVDFVFSDPSLALPLVRAGKLKAIGVTSLDRIPQMPELRTLADLMKIPDFEAVSWHVISAPAGTPGAVVQKLFSEITEILSDRAVVDQITAMGLEPVTPPLTPAETRRYIASETAKWGHLLETLNLAGTQ